MDSEETGFWNTWDPLGMNRFVKFPELYEIRISIYSPEFKAYTSKFYFIQYNTHVGNVLKVYARQKDSNYSKIDLSFKDFIFTIEQACFGSENLVLKIIPRAVIDPFTMLLVEVSRAWQLDGEVELSDEQEINFPCKKGRLMIIQAGQDFHSNVHDGKYLTFGVYSDENSFFQDLRDNGTLNEQKGKGTIAVLGFQACLPLKIVACLDNVKKVGSVEESIAKAKLEHEQKAMKIIGGEFEGCAQAMTSIINWELAWDQLNERPYTLLTREWADRYMVGMGIDKTARGPCLGLWDTFFNALLHSVEDKELSESNMFEIMKDSSLIDGQFPPNYIVSGFLSGDRSQPPVGSLITWKIFRKHENREFLKWIYPRLKKWHEWWKKQRDGNKDGLLEWGSNAKTKYRGNAAGTLFAAKCESGMDNSPLYDDAKYDRKIGTMNLTDIGLNSLFTADALYLSKIACELGYHTDSDCFLKEWNGMKKKINDYLWNEKKKAYMDRYWNGAFSSRLAPTTFYPLIARVPTRKRAETIIHHHLLNEKEFWGQYVIPSISRNDKAFKDQLYWRGRIWPPLNYLVYTGLKEYEMDEIAHEFAKKSVRLFMNDWRSKGHCHENYNAITGTGDDVPTRIRTYMEGSDRFYSWGALLPLLGIEELFDVEMENGIRFGNCFLTRESILKNIRLRGLNLTIEASRNETRVWREGFLFFHSIPGTTVRNYDAKEELVVFRALGYGKTHFTLNEFEPGTRVLVRIDDKKNKQLRAEKDGAIKFSSFLDGKNYKKIIIKKEN